MKPALSAILPLLALCLTGCEVKAHFKFEPASPSKIREKIW